MVLPLEATDKIKAPGNSFPLHMGPQALLCIELGVRKLGDGLTTRKGKAGIRSRVTTLTT